MSEPELDSSPLFKRKRNAKTTVVSSESDSESSHEDVILTRRRGVRRYRVTSPSESGSTSGSDVGRPTRKKCHVIVDSEIDSSLTDSEIENAFSPKNKEVKNIESSEDSSNSDDCCERCIICFKSLRFPKAQPSNCSHWFHSECLKTWSKTSNTCPIDRVKFTAIVTTDAEGSTSRDQVETPPPQDHNADFEPDDTTFCQLCGQHDREHEMLLCDRCDNGYHMNCLDPPMTSIPTSDWFCPNCRELMAGFEILDDEVQDILQGAVILQNRLRRRMPSLNTRSQYPRTRGAQRVYDLINQNNTVNQPSTSTSRPTVQRRRRRTRKRTKYKVELITVEGGSTIEVKVAVNSRKRKKTKKSQKRKKNHAAKVTKVPNREVADSLNTFIPVSNSLDLFGSRPQLDYFSGCEGGDESEGDLAGGLGVLRRARTSVRGMAGRKQLAAQIFNSRPKRPIPVVASSSTPIDIVSSILEEQNKWHNPNAVIYGTSTGEVRAVLNEKSIPVKKSAGGNSNESSSINNNQSQSESKKESNQETNQTHSLPPLQPPPQPPSKLCEDDDFDLYADIEAPSCKLLPPPEPPAMLLALEEEQGGSSPEEAMLVIDDERQTYDPDLPTSPPPSPGKKKKDPRDATMVVDLNEICLPASPEPESSECPNRSLYSKVSTGMARDSGSELEDGECPENNRSELIKSYEKIMDEEDSEKEEKTEKVVKNGKEPFRMTLLPIRPLLKPRAPSEDSDQEEQKEPEEKTEKPKELNCSQESLNEDKSENKNNTSKSSSLNEKENDDVLEIGCEDDRDGLVDITDEEISTYEKNWELEDKTSEKTAGLEGLEAISDCEYTPAEERTEEKVENGPKEEGEIVLEERVTPVAWKKLSKGTKERSYREKEAPKEKSSKKDKKKIREKRKEIERYDVRKIISDKPKKRKVDEFGRDLSSRSRSPSNTRSRRSASPKRKRSVEKRTRAQSRSRNRSRNRSRKRSRGRSSRSRSLSKRKSRSPKRTKNRDKSKERKKRRRSTISCSSCSCSSCDRDKPKKVPEKSKNTKEKEKDKDKEKDKEKDKDRRRSKYKSRNRSPRRRRYSSPVPSKEVFTSGDNILVSVNFKSSKTNERKERRKKEEEPKKKKDKSTKENQPDKPLPKPPKRKINTKNLKPVAIIDLDESPFREQTPSPKEVIVLTDSENEEKAQEKENVLTVTGPKTPPEPHIKFNIVNSKPQIRITNNPLLDNTQNEDDDENDENSNEVVHKGPNTPPEPPIPYDPFEPTKSRSPTPTQEESRASPAADPLPEPENSPPKQQEIPKTPSPLRSPPSKPKEESPEKPKPVPMQDDSDDGGGGGGDSPYSPGSSEGDDLFEPPPQLPTPIAKPKPRAVPKYQISGKPLIPIKKKHPITKNSKGLTGKKEIGIKLDEDQLKILDELPNSAVEMQVKDKFLKKLNRQERVVEEVKLVLKPHYAKKHITKEEYKEILRKSVPKICHSRSGEINPMKIQRLIEAYVKKYRHKKKRKPIPPIQPLQTLKPKPKTSMWC